jgi:C4-dicarboxylate-specific signal transduction histidine kinase
VSNNRQDANVDVGAIRVIANDLNQPLFAITTNTDAIARMLESPRPNLAEVRAALADICSDALRVSRMVGSVQRLLEAQLDAPAILDVRELVNDCVVAMQTEMFAQQVACEVDTAPHLPGVRGVRNQLVQMLMNLVTNSLEAMAGVHVRERRLALRALRHDSRSIAISVEDTGVGIAPEDESLVFEPLFTAKPRRSGLGLAICRSIINAHGGHIMVAPGQGSGAAFKVILPASS